MNKPEQIKAISAKMQITQKDAQDFIECYHEMLIEFFEDGGNNIRLGNLGTLKVVERAERRYQNIQTKETAIAPAHFTVTFTPSPSLKGAVNGSSELAVAA